MSLQQIFENQAKACESLGSPFTARVLRAVYPLLDENNPVGEKVLNWAGDASSGADSVPLRLSGGFHALVLGGKDAGLAAVYPPATADDLTLQSALKNALTNHSDTLLKWLESAPQTNESGRSAPLVAAGHLLARHFNMPLSLLELGASAGLNLRWDHLLLDLGDRRLGPSSASLVLKPDWRGALPEPADLNIARRAGVDLNPLDPSDPQDRLRLLSYIWPDQTDRLARMRAALELAIKYPATITKSDAIDWLAGELDDRPTGMVTVIYHTIAWQYFPSGKRKLGQQLIEETGRKATADAPLVWLSMENDSQELGPNDPQKPGANLIMRLWPGNQTICLGRADFHGRWVQWDVGQSLPAPRQ